MKITHIDAVQSRRPVPLPRFFQTAWNEPNSRTTTGLHFAFYRVHTKCL
jgi:hypothetical protein